jgi:hypothetical protein
MTDTVTEVEPVVRSHAAGRPMAAGPHCLAYKRGELDHQPVCCGRRWLISRVELRAHQRLGESRRTDKSATCPDTLVIASPAGISRAGRVARFGTDRAKAGAAIPHTATVIASRQARAMLETKAPHNHLRLNSSRTLPLHCSRLKKSSNHSLKRLLNYDASPPEHDQHASARAKRGERGRE